jgi:hypothetical protein
MERAAGARWSAVYADPATSPGVRAAAFALLKDLADPTSPREWQTEAAETATDF